MSDYDPQNDYERSNYDALAKEADRRKLIKDIADAVEKRAWGVAISATVWIFALAFIIYWLFIERRIPN